MHGGRPIARLCPSPGVVGIRRRRYSILRRSRPSDLSRSRQGSLGKPVGGQRFSPTGGTCQLPQFPQEARHPRIVLAGIKEREEFLP